MEKLAIHGGQPIRKAKLFYGRQWIDCRDIQAACNALKGDLITCGPKIGELEEKLAAYREARENAKPTSLGNGVTMGGSVSEDEYGISYDASILETFDSREIAEAYGTANTYVEDTLGISVETRNTTYHCVDPRIWAIYSAEDKGVANGYDPENIYVVEYCDNGTWQYLILVREGKGSAWKVIHHGSSYME